MEVREFGIKNQKKIMFIPGNMMCWKQFKGVIPFLADSYHVTAVSQDGFDGTGETTYTDSSAMAEKLEGYIRDELGGGIDLVFGESFGSAAAAVLYHRQNVHVGSLIMSGPQYMDLGILNGLLMRVIPVNQYRLCGKSKNADKLPFLLRMYTRGDSQSLLKQFENVPDNISLVSLQNCMKEALKLYRDIDSFEPDYNAKAAVWYGSEEPNMRTALMKLTRAFPALYIRRFNSFGHGEIISHPEMMAEEIRKFMKETGDEE